MDSKTKGKTIDNRFDHSIDFILFLDDKKLDKKSFKKLLKTKKSRIILRNVSFKVNEDIIKDEFKQFGRVVDVNIPKKADGKMFGFCFVGFDNIKSALKAIKEMNGKPLLGRTIAVDFALAKKKFQTQTQSDNQEKKNEVCLDVVRSCDAGDSTGCTNQHCAEINQEENGYSHGGGCSVAERCDRGAAGGPGATTAGDPAAAGSDSAERSGGSAGPVCGQ